MSKLFEMKKAATFLEMLHQFTFDVKSSKLLFPPQIKHLEWKSPDVYILDKPYVFMT